MLGLKLNNVSKWGLGDDINIPVVISDFIIIIIIAGLPEKPF